MNFRTDLERGIAVEQKVLAIIRKKHPCATLIEGFKGYDIWIPEIKQGIEVKYDPMSNETRNIVVEIEMSGVPSALSTTQATWWVFYDGKVFAWIKFRNLIRCIWENKLVYAEFVGNGDRNKKKAFLIPKKLLFRYAKLQEGT